MLGQPRDPVRWLQPPLDKEKFKKEAALFISNISSLSSLSQRILLMKEEIQPLHARPDLVG